MDTQTKTELIAAVSLLISSPNAHKLYRQMLDAAPLMARNRDIQLTGESADLNTLARLKSSHPETFANIIALAERKRAEAGYDPLEAEVVSKFDKAAYMQQFMNEKRLRERRAADIENAQRSERDKLVGRTRLDFMQRQSATWKKQLDAYMERLKLAAAPGRMRKEDLTQARTDFWAKVDAQLDALEDARRTGKLNKATSASLADLEAALKFDPYA